MQAHAGLTRARGHRRVRRSLAEALLKEDPADRVLRSKLGDVHEKLGNLVLYAADFPAAERSYRRVQRVLQQSGDPAAAHPHYAQSLAILDALAGDVPGLENDRYLPAARSATPT